MDTQATQTRSLANSDSRMRRRPCNAINHTEDRVLVLQRVCVCWYGAHERASSCPSPGFQHIDTLKSSLGTRARDPIVTIPPDENDYAMLKPVEKYLSRWYRSSSWEFVGFIPRSGTNAKFKGSHPNYIFALLERHTKCGRDAGCQHRTGRGERAGDMGDTGVQDDMHECMSTSEGLPEYSK